MQARAPTNAHERVLVHKFHVIVKYNMNKEEVCAGRTDAYRKSQMRKGHNHTPKPWKISEISV